MENLNYNGKETKMHAFSSSSLLWTPPVFLRSLDEGFMNLTMKISGQHSGGAVYDLIFAKKTPPAQWQALFNGNNFHVHIFSKMYQRVANAYSQGLQDKEGTPQLKIFIDFKPLQAWWTHGFVTAICWCHICLNCQEKALASRVEKEGNEFFSNFDSLTN